MDFCYIIQPISHFGTFLYILVDVIFFNHHPGSSENPIIIDDDLGSFENPIVISDEVHDDDGYSDVTSLAWSDSSQDGTGGDDGISQPFSSIWTPCSFDSDVNYIPRCEQLAGMFSF